MSALPREAARWSGVVPDPGGCTPFGEMARWERRSATVCAVFCVQMRVYSVECEDVLEPHRTARWRAAAAVSIEAEERSEERLSLPISVRKGWMRAGSPVWSVRTVELFVRGGTYHCGEQPGA